jgi:nucleoside phosphorylase/CheY-like chemotaxis protein
MISILVVEDTPYKAAKIREVLESIQNIKFEIVVDLVNARKQLQDQVNLLILDLQLPERFSDIAQDSKGLEFILELKKSRRLKIPDHIIGLTEHTDVHEKYKPAFDESLTSLVHYDPAEQDWENKIRIKIDEIIQSSLARISPETLEFDVAFITALRTPELDAVLDLDYNWEKTKIHADSANYFIGKARLANGKELKIVSTHLPQMGMVATATSAMKLIQHFRPKFLIMTGICGGVEGKVNLGDVVISDMSFDLESGKIVVDEDGTQGFEPDYRVIPLNSSLKEDFMDLSNDSQALAGIKSKWKGDKVHGELNLHIGPVGSGAAVISNRDYIETKIKHQRKLIAIDMESYAIFYCAQFCTKPQPIPILIKSVSDYANPDKADNMQKYCATMSANAADYIIKNILTFD